MSDCRMTLCNQWLKLERSDGGSLLFSVKGWSTNLGGGYDQPCDLLEELSMERQGEMINRFTEGCGIDGLLSA